MLADRILAVPRSPFYSIMELAQQRGDCIYLQLGEPDFTTPAHIREAVKKALDQGYTHYGSDRGAPELRQQLAKKLARTGAEFDWRDEILVTAGGQAALHVAVMSLVNPGEEIIILLPHYPPYVVNSLLCGGKAVFVKLRPERGFIPDPAEIEAAITPKTKAIIVLTPNNPTRAVYPADVLGQILEVAKRHNVTIISDETYESLVYDGVHTSFLSFPGARDHVVHVSGFSKTYAMTGLRVGYLAAPREKLIQFLKYHHTVNISANVPSQMACAAAMQGPQDCVTEMRDEYHRRRDLLIPMLNDIPGISCHRPQGAFYVFPNIAGCLGSTSAGGKAIATDEDFALALLEEQHVATVFGAAFGMSPYLRISYATDEASLEEGCRRIARFVATLR